MNTTRLKELRAALNLSQAALADALGVKRLTVFRWENGVTEPHLSQIREIAAFFGVPAGELVDERRAS